eukprot:scpid108270/ scgid6974/ 
MHSMSGCIINRQALRGSGRVRLGKLLVLVICPTVSDAEPYSLCMVTILFVFTLGGMHSGRTGLQGSVDLHYGPVDCNQIAVSSFFSLYIVPCRSTLALSRTGCLL